MRVKEPFSIYKLNIISFVLFTGIVIVMYVVMRFLAGREITAWKWWMDIIFLVIAIIVSTIMHEGLHGVGHIIFNGAKVKDLKFGVYQLAPYCSYSNKPLTKYGAIMAVLFPSLVLGISLWSYTIGYASNYCWIILTAFVIASGTGDYAYVIRLLGYKDNVTVYDLEEEVGFEVEINIGKDR